jgi:hypothetical protein
MASFHHRTAVECLAALGASPDGLDAAEAARWLADHGPNRLPDQRGLGPAPSFVVQRCPDRGSGGHRGDAAPG